MRTSLNSLYGTALVLLTGLVLFGCSTVENRMDRIQSLHPEWGQETVRKLASWQIEPGMTREMVHAALGKPDAVFTEGGEEVWGYAVWVVTYSVNYRRIVYFVHFREGKVVGTRGDVNRLRTLA